MTPSFAIAPPASPLDEVGSERLWDYEAIEIEDDEPVDSLISEKQQRLAVNSAYSSYQPGVPFLAAANVGLFCEPNRPAIVPDVMVSLNVQVPEDWTQKKHRSYFVQVLGKPPELAIELVSNSKGNELSGKLIDYARIGVLYYVVFDPLLLLGQTMLYAFELREGVYRPLARPWFEQLNLGLVVWQGAFEGRVDRWLRWCDRSGAILLTGDELAAQERDRADAAERLVQVERDRAAAAERQLAEMAERLRALTGEES